MNIGIDFDNTIAMYDSLFKQVAEAEEFIPANWNGGGKQELKSFLRSQPKGEKTWMKLQGLVYGKYMHRAEMMPWIANFLISCKGRKHRVFIVSHKTEHGHFDPEKVSLREEALKWMRAKRFFDPEYIGLNRDDVYFADTREEKVSVIAHLKCDWFIDDLPEIFEEKHFPSDTKKILLGFSSKMNPMHGTAVLNSWRKISETMLRQTTDEDIISWLGGFADHPMGKLQQISGQGNSIVYKVTTLEGHSYALKVYPDQLGDARPRLETEFQALQLLHRNNITNVPKAVSKDNDLNLGLYEWINGKKVSRPSVADIEQAVDFVNQLCHLSRKNDAPPFKPASEACLSANELVSQIDNRLLRLKLESKRFSELAAFLERAFEPLWAEAKDECIALWPHESRDNDLPKEKQILSPSDFGFHNSLESADGGLAFFDFDYFGWDDPVKLTADFIWHPAMKLGTDLILKWKKAMGELFSNDPDFEARLKAAMPLYGFRWTMIILNEFLPGMTERRQEAGEAISYDPEKSRKIQLGKAKDICDEIKAMRSHTAFA